MKILLDECLPVDFRHQMPGHEVHSAEWAGFMGMKNLAQRRISILVIRSRTNQIEDLLPIIGTILSKLAEIQPGQITFTS